MSSTVLAPLRSMTGFGAARSERGGLVIEAEVKTVNSRFLDPTFRLPRAYAALEIPLREDLSTVFSRGRVEVMVTRTPVAPERCAVQINRAVFDAYWTEQVKLAESLQLNTIEVRARILTDILSRREVLGGEVETQADEQEVAFVRQVVIAAAENARKMREEEGSRLRTDLLARLEAVRLRGNSIEQLSSVLPETYRQRLTDRLSRLLRDSTEPEVDPARLAQEVAFQADRSDITEELVRLRSHVTQFQEIVQERPEGRQLQFLLQEVVRELNTISSKAQHADIQQHVVEAKAEAERLREQVQNVE